MPVNTKVKDTDQLFEVVNEENSSRDVYALEAGKSYSGYLYKGIFSEDRSNDDETVFTCTEERIPAIFSTDQLEQIPLPLKIRTVIKRPVE